MIYIGDKNMTNQKSNPSTYYKVSRRKDTVAVSNHYGISGARSSRDKYKGYHIYKETTDDRGKTVWKRVE